jgi:RNA polymerase sigma-70 factor (ECF subfamily)
MATRQVETRPVRRGVPSDDDRFLVLAFQAGDGAAYRAIHERYRGRVEALCRRLLGNYHDAEEATQETFLRVYQALPRFNGQYRLGSWIMKIATNVCLDVLRARTRERNGDSGGNGNVIQLPVSELVSFGDGNGSGDGYPKNGNGRNGNGHGNGHVEDDPHDVLERRSREQQVHEVLAELPEHYRTALVLREFEGLSHEQIGSVLGGSPSQVKALLHRARRRFRTTWIRAGRTLGLAPIPFLGGWLRRATTRAAEVSAPVASSPVAQTVMAPATVSAAEKVVAIVATVAVTGAVGLGIARDRYADSAREALGKALSAPVVQEAAPSPGQAAGAAKSKGVVPGQAVLPKVDPSFAVIASPDAQPKPDLSPSPPVATEDPSPAPSDPAPAESSPPPSVEPAPGETEPAEPPALTPPAYSSSLVLQLRGEDGLALDELSLTEASLEGEVAGTFNFFQRLQGSGTLGDVPWTVEVYIEGSAGTAGGTFWVWIAMLGPEGAYFEYTGEGGMSPATRGDDGVWRSYLQGNFELKPGAGEGAAPMVSGTLENSQLAWWADGAPIQSSFFLTESR